MSNRCGGCYPARFPCFDAHHGCRLSPCLLRSHEDAKACSLVTALLLRHSSSIEGPDTSVVDAEPAPSSSRTPAAALLHASVKPTMHTSSPVPAAVSVPSISAAGGGEQGGPPARLPPPLPKPAPAAALPLASAGELLLAPNKARSRSGSMEGNAGYASFKKELKVTIYFMHVVGLYFHLLRLKSLPLQRGFTFKCRMVFRRRYRNLTTIEVNSFPAVSSAWWRGAHAIELGSASRCTAAL